MPVLNFVNQCFFDNGAIRKLNDALKSLGVKAPIIVTDKGIVAAGILREVQNAIGKEVLVFDETEPNPRESQVNLLKETYKTNSCDGFIALGGGSAIDLSKAAAILVTHDGELARFGTSKKGSKLIGNVAPIIAIPTTAGTGSEVSVGSLIILESGFKELFVSPNLIPPIAICDPQLTLGLPPFLTAATGMDALTHCIEAVLSPNVNPPAEAIGLDGIERIYSDGWLFKAFNEPSNINARWNMLMASSEGALAFVKGLGSCHALAHASASVKGINPHHGTLNAIYLPHVLQKIENCADELVHQKLIRIKRAMGIETNARIFEKIIALNDALSIPPKLSMIGLKTEDCEIIADSALCDIAHFSNCLVFEKCDYQEIFKNAL